MENVNVYGILRRQCMKKKFATKALSLLLAAGLLVSMVPASVSDAKAKKPKLAKKKVTITVKKSAKVKIKNTKRIKKVTWSVTKKGRKIVKLTKKKKTYVTVKGLQKGTAKVKGKVKVKGARKAVVLTLKVTVKKNSSKKTSSPGKTDAPTAPVNGGGSTSVPMHTDSSNTTAPTADSQPTAADISTAEPTKDIQKTMAPTADSKETTAPTKDTRPTAGGQKTAAPTADGQPTQTVPAVTPTVPGPARTGSPAPIAPTADSQPVTGSPAATDPTSESPAATSAISICPSATAVIPVSPTVTTKATGSPATIVPTSDSQAPTSAPEIPVAATGVATIAVSGPAAETLIVGERRELVIQAWNASGQAVAVSSAAVTIGDTAVLATGSAVRTEGTKAVVTIEAVASGSAAVAVTVTGRDGVRYEGERVFTVREKTQSAAHTIMCGQAGQCGAQDVTFATLIVDKDKLPASGGAVTVAYAIKDGEGNILNSMYHRKITVSAGVHLSGFGSDKQDKKVTVWPQSGDTYEFVLSEDDVTALKTDLSAELKIELKNDTNGFRGNVEVASVKIGDINVLKSEGSSLVWKFEENPSCSEYRGSHLPIVKFVLADQRNINELAVTGRDEQGRDIKESDLTAYKAARVTYTYENADTSDPGTPMLSIGGYPTDDSADYSKFRDRVQLQPGRDQVVTVSLNKAWKADQAHQMFVSIEMDEDKNFKLGECRITKIELIAKDEKTEG